MSTKIIAEIGVNHNGDISIAKKLIDVVAESGADYAKFQTFSPKLLSSSKAPKAAYQKETTDETQSQVDMLTALMLPHEAHFVLRDYCDAKGVKFLSSAFDHESLAFLVNEMKLDLIKFGSGELQNAPLIYEAARLGVDIILSTGMSILSDVEQALMVIALGYSENPPDKPTREDFLTAWCDPALRELLKEKVAVLHCTTSYPTPPEDVNLFAMDTLSQAFGLRTGFSDHTEGNAACVAAVARGALIIEKHVTLDKGMDGPDHAASSSPDDFKAMVDDIRFVERAMGHSYRVPSPTERENAIAARKSLVALKPIAKNDVFTRENVTVKRPGGGLSPISFWDILGTKSQRSYDLDDTI